MRARLTPRPIAVILACACFWPANVLAQPGGFGPGGGGFGGPGARPRPTPKKKPEKKKPSDVPETHAASGSGRMIAPGGEPTLPTNPLEIPSAIAEAIGSDAIVDDLSVEGESPRTTRVYGLYFEESQAPGYHFKTSIPPFWFERVQPSLTDPSKPDRASLFGLYYNRRSAERSEEVLFPLFWNLRDTESRSTVLGPWFSRESADESDTWLAPVYFHGQRPQGAYTILPPLLTYFNHDADGGLNIVGPGFCSWKGGSSCDTSTADELDIGLAPFYFSGHDEVEEYRLIPPLLHYHSYQKQERSWVDLWGPVYRKHTEKLDSFHIFPFYFSRWGENERHTTLLPFFHYGYKDDSSLLINPFFLSSTSKEGYETFITWGYAKYRGQTELDMYTPLYWHYRDPDIGFDQKILAPFFMRRKGPREDTTVVFPFYANIERYGLSKSTWITPFFSHSTDTRGWSTNIYPFLFVGRDGFDTHTILAPFFWDFASPTSRSTIGFPLYWRFTDEKQTTQLIGNVFYSEQKVKHGVDWKINIFPFFSYGETPDGHSWDVLLGLAGYTRKGSATQVRSLWIPIQLSE